MSNTTTLRDGQVQVTVTTVINNQAIGSMTVLTAEDLMKSADASALVQIAAAQNYVKCQRIAKAPELAIAPSPEKPERDLRADYEMNSKAAKVAGVGLSRPPSDARSFTCYRLDGQEWNPLLNSTDCRHVIASTPLGYAVDGSHRLQITGRQGSAIRTGSVGGFDNPENRKMFVKACIEWHENDRNYY